MKLGALFSGGKDSVLALYNAMNEAPLSIAAVDKAEAEVSMQIFAHWEVDADEATPIDKLYEITEVATIS